MAHFLFDLADAVAQLQRFVVPLRCLLKHAVLTGEIAEKFTGSGLVTHKAVVAELARERLAGVVHLPVDHLRGAQLTHALMRLA